MEPTDSKLFEDKIRTKNEKKNAFEAKRYLPWICPNCSYNNTNFPSVCENDYCEEDRPGYDELKEKIDLQWKERELKQKTLERAKWPPWWRPRLTRTTSTPLKSRTIPRSLSPTTTSPRLAPSPTTIFPVLGKDEEDVKPIYTVSNFIRWTTH